MSSFLELYNTYGSVKGIHRGLGISYRQARNMYLKAVEDGEFPLIPVGGKPRDDAERVGEYFNTRRDECRTSVAALPSGNSIKRYIFTSAQNDTDLNHCFRSIIALANVYDAELHVARYTYIKHGLGAMGDKSNFLSREESLVSAEGNLSWHPELEPYFSDVRMEIAPGLVWCGEMNILPTAINPVSGLESYTGRQSCIFPHSKQWMHSVASDERPRTKLIYTTGSVTEKNYIQRRAGLNAEFHHCYGGLLVEVDSEGNFWVRQLNADSDGVIYDLDVKATPDGKVTYGNTVEAITWGDHHEYQMDPIVRYLAFGEGQMLDTLRPAYQFSHDILDFSARNLHIWKKGHWHDLFRSHVRGHTSVRDELESVVDFISYEMSRPWCNTVIVDSNHNRYILEWLQMMDYRKDPENAEFFLEAQRYCYETIRQNHRGDLNLMKWYIGPRLKKNADTVKILGSDENFLICEEHGGIECGMHGHRGPDGTRGNPTAFRKMGRKYNLGHRHSAGIYDGVVYAGTSSRLSLDYNDGPSSWSHSHIVTYKNGKRAVVTMWSGKWRA